MTPLALSVTAAEVAYWGTFGIWAVGERVLWFRDIRLKSWNSRQDRGSTLWVVGGAIAGILAGIALASRDVLTLPGPWAWLVAGLVIAWAGLALRTWAVVTLGRSFTTTVVVRPNQTVIASRALPFRPPPLLHRVAGPLLRPWPRARRPVQCRGNGGAPSHRAGQTDPCRRSSTARRPRGELRRVRHGPCPAHPRRLVRVSGGRGERSGGRILQ